jgi:hypothetical protein
VITYSLATYGYAAYVRSYIESYLLTTGVNMRKSLLRSRKDWDRYCQDIKVDCGSSYLIPNDNPKKYPCVVLGYIYSDYENPFGDELISEFVYLSDFT